MHPESTLIVLEDAVITLAIAQSMLRDYRHQDAVTRFVAREIRKTAHKLDALRQQIDQRYATRTTEKRFNIIQGGRR